MNSSAFQCLYLFWFLISISVALRYACNQRNVSCGCGFKEVEVEHGLHRLDEAIPHSWSMLVSIQYDCHHNQNPSTHCCTGTILSDRYILTSASCFDRQANKSALAKDVTVVAGIHSLNQRCSSDHKVDAVLIHSNWSTERNDTHDLALLRLATRLDFSNDVLLSRACLASGQEHSRNIAMSNTTLAVVGWNVSDDFETDKSPVLRQLTFYSSDLNTSDALWHIRQPEG